MGCIFGSKRVRLTFMSTGVSLGMLEIMSKKGLILFVYFLVTTNQCFFSAALIFILTLFFLKLFSFIRSVLFILCPGILTAILHWANFADLYRLSPKACPFSLYTPSRKMDKTSGTFCITLILKAFYYDRDTAGQTKWETGK